MSSRNPKAAKNRWRVGNFKSRRPSRKMIALVLVASRKYCTRT